MKPQNEKRTTSGDDPAADGGPALPAWKAFAVQFSRASGGGGVFSGRIEHLDSGRRTAFASRDELLETLERMLDAVDEPLS